MAADKTTQPGTASPASTWPLAIKARKMMPMVFWASLVPWAIENIELDTICPMRKPREIGVGRRLPMSR